MCGNGGSRARVLLVWDGRADPHGALDALGDLRRRGATARAVLLVTEVEAAVATRAATLGGVTHLDPATLGAGGLAEALRPLLGQPAPAAEPADAGGDLAPAMLWRADSNGAFTHFTRRWLAFTGRSAEKERGTGWLENVHPTDRARFQEAFAAARAQRAELAIDLRMRNAQGSTRWVRHHALPLLRDGSLRGYLGSSFDVSDLVHTCGELRGKLDASERELRELEEAMYAVAHDLDEPLRTLERDLAALAPDPAGGEPLDRETLRGRALEQAGRTRAMLRALFDYARAGRADGPLERISLEEPLRWALGNLREAIQEADAHISAGPLPEALCDPSQMAQVFQNLIANALKFRSAAHVRIGVDAERREGEWLLSVRDDGIGIAHEQHEAVFRLFHRVASRPHAGSGVGLALCKKLVERHGGRIWLESIPGRGTTVYFTLPAGAPAQSTPDPRR